MNTVPVCRNCKTDMMYLRSIPQVDDQGNLMMDNPQAAFREYGCVACGQMALSDALTYSQTIYFIDYNDPPLTKKQWAAIGRRDK